MSLFDVREKEIFQDRSMKNGFLKEIKEISFKKWEIKEIIVYYIEYMNDMK